MLSPEEYSTFFRMKALVGGRGHEQQLGVDACIDLASSASNPKVGTPGNTIIRIEIGPRALSPR